MAVIRGTNGANNLTGGSARDYMYGLQGNDTLVGGAGNDLVAGDQGDDRLYGGVGNDELRGGVGRDLLNGGDGNDYLLGGYDEVADTLYGGAGDDAIQVGEGDVADGATGQDQLILGGLESFDGPSFVFNVDLRQIGGSTAVDTGFQSVTAKNFESASVYLVNALAGSIVYGTNGDDQLGANLAEDASPTAGVTLRGWYGDDTISGSSGADTINGDSGTDLIFGGSGADALYGGSGADLFLVRLETTFPGGPAPTVDQIRDWSADDFFFVQDNPFDGGFGPTFDDIDQANPLVLGAAATSDGGQFLYDRSTGRLSYDVDGVGGEGPIALYTLVGRPALSAADFIIDF